MKNLFLSLFLLLSLSVLYSKNTQLYFDNFTTEEGLSDNYINCILQDKSGWMWIGTGMGIERFDGLKFKEFPIYDLDGIHFQSVLVRNFFESSDGTLYACIEEFGLVKFNRQKEYFERLVINGLAVACNVSVKEIVEDKAHNLWVATKKGLLKIDLLNQKVTTYDNKKDTNSLICNYVRTLALDENSQLWIGTKEGLDKLDISTGEFVHFANLTPKLGDEVFDIYIDSNNNIWIGTGKNGIIKLDKSNNIIENLIPNKSDERSITVRSIFQDDAGEFWIGTRGGLFLYNESNKRIQSYKNDLWENKSLIHNSVMYVSQDRKGDMWVGTRGGLSYLVKEKQLFKHYKALPNNSKYLNNSEVYCIWMDAIGNIWTGTENGGVNILDRKKGTYKYLTVENGLSNNCVKSIVGLGDNLVLIGTFNGGLNSYNIKTGQLKCYKHNDADKNSISDNIVWDICVDKIGRIWVGTAFGLDRFYPETGKFEHFPQFDEMVNGVTWIEADTENDLWLSSEVLKVFRPGYGIINTFQEKGRGYFSDSKGNNWIMTSGRGIVKYDKYKGIVGSYTDKDGLASNLTYCMLEDDSNKLWVSTSNGLSCFDREQATFKNFLVINGIQSNQFYYGASYKSPQGEMLFGGKIGFNIFNPENIIVNTYVPPVFITDFKIFNQSVEISDGKDAILSKSIFDSDTIVVPYKYNVLTFEFAALNYSNSSQNNYKYMLVGFNNEWTETTDSRSATYTNLNPGEYTFKVIASNDNNVWNNTGTQKTLIIKPPFYKTILFIVLMVILAIAITVTLLFYLFKIWELKKNLEYEKKEAHRIHELDAFKLKFFTNISHEIKTPLTLIISPLDRILNFNLSKEEISENLKLMSKNAQQLMTLITQLLDYRKLEAGKLSVTHDRGDIVRYCEELFLSFEPLLKEKNVTYNFRTLNDKIITYFDADKVKKIVDNLVSNAIKYNQDGGHVSMILSLVIDESSVTRVSDDYVQIMVKDSGIGISEKDQLNIFKRFYSGNINVNNSSTGIGLAFTKELVKLLNGTIRVESEAGIGSTFVVKLPLINNVVEKQADSVLPVSKKLPEPKQEVIVPAKGNEKENIILIVEDNKDVRYLLKSHFEKNYTIYEAENGEEGCELALSIIPNIIISDVMMPILDGVQLCDKLKNDERTSHIPILHLTALTAREHVMRSLSKGADDFITKPFDIVILQQKIDNLLSMREALRARYSKEMILKPTSVRVTSPDEKFLQKAIKVVEENIEDSELDIDKFVKIIGMSRTQLYRKVFALTNMTVKEFISDMRLKRAYQMLTENDLPVSEVAYSVGFKDVSYFGKCLKKKYGFSASQIIKNKQQPKT